MHRLSIRLVLVFMCIAVLSFPACRKSLNAKVAIATVRDLRGLDGCRFTLELEQPDKAGYHMLEPLNLHDFVQEPAEGQKVKIRYHIVRSPSICMVGQVVKIESLRLR
jgi:hypothetical protein